ncbi:probable low-specificity L-threonine aldolase 2 [Amphibalanus amphitrite]|uniref:probable low-specificity L-threonine aldolase 2 n=1 Tax=Amphibalanus amphitrite TaxID=1232801 RepID=UPI001C906138|nr:probable low-specificity L-threonine aldolase 2 [Amphibalanus amphitrite]
MSLCGLLTKSRPSVISKVWDSLRVCSAAGKLRTLTRAPLRPYYAADSSKMAPNDRTKVIDLRSDTVTRPSAEMYRAMVEASVGDDVFGDDPTVNELEQLACGEMGFEAAIYVPSGTMANLIAIMVHCPRGGEIIIGDKSHINLYEQGGSASIAGVHGWTLPNNADGTIAIEKLRSAVRADDVHYPVTSLICLENTHNACGGKVLPLEYLDQVVSLSREIGIPLHMDGARLANAAIYCRLVAAGRSWGVGGVRLAC